MLEKIAAVSFMCHTHLEQIKALSLRLFSDVAVFAFSQSVSQSGDDIRVILLLWFSWVKTSMGVFYSPLLFIFCL